MYVVCNGPLPRRGEAGISQLRYITKRRRCIMMTVAAVAIETSRANEWIESTFLLLPSIGKIRSSFRPDQG